MHSTTLASLLPVAILLTTGIVSAQVTNETTKLVPSDGADSDYFGESVAISGTTAIVGAYGDDDNGSTSGSAYLFDATTGAQTAKILPSDGAASEQFGCSVALSGTTAIVGARYGDDNGTNSGSAYLFDTTTGAQTAKLLPLDGAAGDRFGASVAISGTTAIVGAPDDEDNGDASGSAYLFDTTTGAQTAKLLPSDGNGGDFFGEAVAISGTTAIVGAFWDDDNEGDSGSAYLFDTVTGAQMAKLSPSDAVLFAEFGWSVAISGTTAIVGARNDNGDGSGSAYSFDTTTGAQIAELLPLDGTAGDWFGSSVAIDGTTVIVGAMIDYDNGPGWGSAYAFDTTTGAQMAKLLPLGGAGVVNFGKSVSVSGLRAIVGAPAPLLGGSGSGSAYIFTVMDCNENGIFDADDISTGTSSDCNGNGIPDDCEVDCNSNGVPDDCEFGPLLVAQYCLCGAGAPCGNTDVSAGCANYSGTGSRVTACGSSSVASDDLVLRAENIQPQQFGLFFMGAGQTQVPFGNGQLCVNAAGLGLFRFPVRNSGSPGVIAQGPGMLAHASSHFGVFGTPTAGQAWNFQCWFRDPLGPCGSTFNLSNGMTVTFVP